MTTADHSRQAGSNSTTLNSFWQPDRISKCRFSSTHTFIAGTTATGEEAQAGCSRYVSSWEGQSAVFQRCSVRIPTLAAAETHLGRAAQEADPEGLMAGLPDHGIRGSL